MSGKLLRATLLLAGCCVALAGCIPPQDGLGSSTTLSANTTGSPNTTGPLRTLPDAPEPVGVPWKPAEPSLEYFAMDAPEGMSQAVAVGGHPLVYTRQLMPLDAEGNLVGEGEVEKQIDQVLSNLAAVLEASGSSLTKIVRLNVYADSPDTVDLLREQLSRKTDAAVRPAISSVVSPLPNPEAKIAVDAVAVASESGETVVCQRLDSVAGDVGCADAAVMPTGGVAYLSGQPDKSPLPDSVSNSLNALLKIVDELKFERSRIVQLKVFVHPATAADDVRRELKRFFPARLTPPIVFVEWIASAPVEIEMVVHFPPTRLQSAGPVSYLKASATFSRAASVQADRQIFISSLVSREMGDGKKQVRDVFEQLKVILQATDSDLEHLAKATYYVCNDDASNMLNKLRPEFYNPKRPPAASKAMVHGTGQWDRTFTMDMIAVGGRVSN
jgi:enamine deaminase RidA (YjgF/YER057c/UK114 family)